MIGRGNDSKEERTGERGSNTIIVGQKKIIRIMNFEEPNSHTEPLFAQLQFLKTCDMHELQPLSFMYDCQNHLAPTHFHL